VKPGQGNQSPHLIGESDIMLMESTKRGGKVCGWCSVLLKSQRKVGGFARWVGVYGR